MQRVFSEIPEVYHLPGFHEPFSAISHLAGALFFSFLGLLLFRRGRGDTARVAYLAVYAFSCVLLFSMSGVYHMMVRGGTAGLVMERLDHSAIFVLIAGTFTPIHGILFRGPLRWGPLLFIWTVAILGITLKSIFFLNIPEWVGVSLYLAMGWFGMFGGVLLWRKYGFRFIRPLVLGGIAYSVGAAMEFSAWPVILAGIIHAHDVFHVAVLVGAFYHWGFIWQFAAGEPTPKPPPAA